MANPSGQRVITRARSDSRSIGWHGGRDVQIVAPSGRPSTDPSTREGDAGPALRSSSAGLASVRAPNRASIESRSASISAGPTPVRAAYDSQSIGRFGDLPIEKGLRRGRIVHLAVAVAPVADEVDDDVAREGVPVLERDARGPARPHRVLAVDVEDRHREPQRDVRGEAGGVQAQSARRVKPIRLLTMT